MVLSSGEDAMDIIQGIVNTLLVLLLFGLGVFVGVRFVRVERETEPASGSSSAEKPERYTDAEIRRMEADQQAFRILMGYSMDMAYGQIPPDDSGGDGR